MKTHFSHFPDHCVVYVRFECSLIFILEPSCSILSERAQNETGVRVLIGRCFGPRVEEGVNWVNRLAT